MGSLGQRLNEAVCLDAHLDPFSRIKHSFPLVFSTVSSRESQWRSVCSNFSPAFEDLVPFKCQDIVIIH